MTIVANEALNAIKNINRAGDDYYKILGVDKSANDDEIKKAYRKLALKLHPDKCNEEGAEEAFKRVNEAFSVLSDAKKRNVFDQCGVDGLRGSGGGGGQGSPQDIFEAFFRGQGGGDVFQMGGNGRGFQTFHFSSGGPSGGVFQFSSNGMSGGRMGGAFPGAARQRERAAEKRRAEEEAEEEASAELPGWAKSLQTVASLIGPFAPLLILAVCLMGMMLLSTIVQILMSRAMIIIPIMYVTEGKTKWTLLTSIVVLALFGVI